MSTSAAGKKANLGNRFREEIERTIQRSIKGLEYIASPEPAVGITPKDLIHKRGTLSLYHYRPVAPELYRVPVLLVMATTNRGYIFDLAPGQSMVEFLLRRGFDIFVMDWNPPKPEETHLRLQDYTLDFIPDCIRRVQQRTGVEDVTVAGYCMGGVLSLIYAALHADGPTKNLVCFTTPINWEHMGLARQWANPRLLDTDRLVDHLGNVPAEILFTFFEMQKPASRIAGHIKMWDNMWNDQYVKSFRMFDRWSVDMLPLPGEFFRQTIHDLIWGNKLHKGELVLDGRRVDLKNIQVPILHAVADNDQWVPYEAARPLIQNVGSSDKEEAVLKGGHVSVIAGVNATERLWPKLDSWLGRRSI
jgi:polyhydroxyalkanoate synthase